MKPEARILLSRCSSNLCASIVTRGESFDAVVIASGCRELCVELNARGYAGELRYARGDCTCGYPEPPRLNDKHRVYEDLLVKLIGLALSLRGARLS